MKLSFLILATVASFVAAPMHAAWYWPFGDDEDSPDAKPRLHRLLENANDLIEQAEDAASWCELAAVGECYDGDGFEIVVEEN